MNSLDVGVFSYQSQFLMTFPYCHRYSLSIDCMVLIKRKASPFQGDSQTRRMAGYSGSLSARSHTEDRRPFPDVDLSGTPDPTTCEDYHHD